MAKQLLFNESGGGGGLSGGTVLWQNPNPAQAFSGQYIDLPDISQYNFISVKWMSYVGDNFVMETIWRKDEFEAVIQPPRGGAVFGLSVLPRAYARVLYHDAATNRYVMSRAYIDSTGATADNTIIPQQVIGY